MREEGRGRGNERSLEREGEYIFKGKTFYLRIA